MSQSTLLIVVAAVVVVAAVAFFLYRRSARSQALRERFGAEYGRAVEQTGSRSRAEADLLERQTRVAKLPLRDLTADERATFAQAWTARQAEFVDDPQAAVVHADVLLGDLMKARGYPVADFEQRAADISVDHPLVVENYRAAHDIAVRHTTGESTTEDLRRAMIHYRTLFDAVVGEAPQGAETPVVAVR